MVVHKSQQGSATFQRANTNPPLTSHQQKEGGKKEDQYRPIISLRKGRQLTAARTLYFCWLLCSQLIHHGRKVRILCKLG